MHRLVLVDRVIKIAGVARPKLANLSAAWFSAPRERGQRTTKLSCSLVGQRLRIVNGSRDAVYRFPRVAGNRRPWSARPTAHGEFVLATPLSTDGDLAAITHAPGCRCRNSILSLHLAGQGGRYDALSRATARFADHFMFRTVPSNSTKQPRR
jgi:hypothetical protein